MSEQPMRLCKDCRLQLAGDRCGHSSSLQPPEVDPVNGRRTPARPSECWMMRMLDYPTVCGPQGKHWEARDA